MYSCCLNCSITHCALWIVNLRRARKKYGIKGEQNDSDDKLNIEEDAVDYESLDVVTSLSRESDSDSDRWQWLWYEVAKQWYVFCTTAYI